MLRAGIIGLLAAFVSVVLVRLLFSVIPDHWTVRTLIVSGGFGWEWHVPWRRLKMG